MRNVIIRVVQVGEKKKKRENQTKRAKDNCTDEGRMASQERSFYPTGRTIVNVVSLY